MFEFDKKTKRDLKNTLREKGLLTEYFLTLTIRSIERLKEAIDREYEAEKVNYSEVRGIRYEIAIREARKRILIERMKSEIEDGTLVELMDERLMDSEVQNLKREIKTIRLREKYNLFPLVKSKITLGEVLNEIQRKRHKARG